VDDVYELLDTTNEAVAATRQAVSVIATTQRRHGNRLEEIQTALDLSVGRSDRLEEGQHRLEQAQREQGAKLDAILAAVRGEQPSE
jgi:hypothetical protein